MSNKNWKKDSVQFPRLIAELNAAGVFQDAETVSFLKESMDLTTDEILDVVERAERKFEVLKKGAK
jgi:hypothetical protein